MLKWMIQFPKPHRSLEELAFYIGQIKQIVNRSMTKSVSRNVVSNDKSHFIYHCSMNTYITNLVASLNMF